MEELLKVLADPICSQIVQILRVRGKMTIAEIIAVSPKLSRATVYRRMEKMLQTGAVRIAETRKVRGQTEHTYDVGEIWIGTPGTQDDCRRLVTMGLLQIFDRYSRYFDGDDVDVQRDSLFLSHYSISLNDADFSEMLCKFRDIIDSYQEKQDTEGARLRSLFLLSAPEGETNE